MSAHEEFQPGRTQWSAIFAGAVVAAGISFALNAFAAGIGLAVASTAPTWRDSSAWLWLLSGLYLLFVALCAFAVGGYIAGRLRTTVRGAITHESEFCDGLCGLVSWGLTVIIAAVLALGLAAAAAPAISRAGGAGATQSVAGENIIAPELDILFRGDRETANIAYRRAEAARILLKASSHSGIGSADRDYLAVIAANSTGIDLGRAEERVDRVIAASRDELHKARVAAVIQAFFIGAALFVGAAVAWLSAVEGGRDRDTNSFPVWDWSIRRRSPELRPKSTPESSPRPIV